MPRTTRIALVFFTLCWASGRLYAVDVQPLRQCIDDLKTTQARYYRWIPGELLGLDRKLVHMAYAIPVLEQNMLLLDQRAQADESDPTRKFLAYNSAESCQVFLDGYRAQFRRFVALLVSVLFTLLALTGRSFFYMTSPSPLKRGSGEPPSPAADLVEKVHDEVSDKEGKSPTGTPGSSAPFSN